MIQCRLLIEDLRYLKLCLYSFTETSKVDYVLFEAAGLLKDGLIREWASISRDEVKGLRSYLLSYVINHPTLSSYIRERIVQVVAIGKSNF